MFLKNGVVVQLVRIRACHARGRGFESRPHRQRSEVFEKSLNESWGFFFARLDELSASGCEADAFMVLCSGYSRSATAREQRAKDMLLLCFRLIKEFFNHRNNK